MSRVFRPHELKQAVLEALAEHGPANGYALMRVLADRIGPAWRPSPGAIYPALLALEDLGLIAAATDDRAGHGAGRTYDLSSAGAVAVDRDTGTLERVARRARTIETPAQLGPLLDRFAATFPDRRRRVSPDTEQLIGAVLARAAEEINTVMTTTTTEETR